MKKFKVLGKKILSFIGAAALSVSLLGAMPQTMIKADAAYGSAREITAQMGLGWNLGNSLDATGRGSSYNITDFETYWGNPVVTKNLINTVKAKGFKTIRIPVSWYEHVSYNNGNYTIDSKWLSRVKEVVDYAYTNDMYVILNIHHENWINRSDFASSYDAMSRELKAIWKQIATYFANYDQKLIFEGMNEPRAVGTSIEWSGNSACYDVVNKLNADFVNTVRSVASPYQKNRLLMIPGYAASSSTSVLASIKVPNDSFVAVSIHAYSPYEFTMGNGNHTSFTSAYAASLDGMFRDFNAYFTSKGIPVVIGEFSASNYNNTQARVDWAKYYINCAKSQGIPCVLWDNNSYTNGSDSGEAHGYLNRSQLTWYPESEKVINAMFSVLSSGGNSSNSGSSSQPQTGTHPSLDSVSSAYVVTSTPVSITEYCTDSIAINTTQLASGRDLAVQYSGSGIPKMAMVDSNWKNWKEVSAYDADVTNGIAYFSYNDFQKAWGTSTSSIKYVYVCGPGITMKKIVSIPAGTTNNNASQGGNTGNQEQGNTGNNNQNNNQNQNTNTNNNGIVIQDGWYYIKNVNAQKYLQVANNQGKDGQNVELGTGSGVDGQKWYVTNAGDGYVTIKSATGYMLDVVGGGTGNDVNINIWSANGWDPQKFKIVTTANNGEYGILTKVSGDQRCLDAAGAKKADGTNVLQWSYSAKANQVWTFEPTNANPNTNTGNQNNNNQNNNQTPAPTPTPGQNTDNGNQGGNTGNQTPSTGSKTSVAVKLSGNKVDLSACGGRRVVALTFDLTANSTGSGAVHLYTANGGWIGSADYAYTNSKSVTIDLSTFSGIGAMDLYTWWNSAGASITNVQAVVE